jgi:methylenetetrahydrofolate dehydrogenase (NADP+)/methenyltetrahydrofolate cyclohydrolase
MKLIDGKLFADRLCESLQVEVQSLEQCYGVKPTIAVVLVGDDPASHVYVRNKIKRCEQIGIGSQEFRLASDIAQDELVSLIESLNSDSSVHGILVQLPLPDQINEDAVISAISPNKDVDGFHIDNVGALSVGRDGMVPCTPLGSLMLLEDTLGDLSGLDVVVVGRSNIVGKPLASLLLQKNCTVTIAHSRTKNLPDVCRRADILVAAVGRPKMIKASWVKPGATVIDVGINRIEENGKATLCGDVDFDDVKVVAGAMTPVPGGVGPMTIACLMYNTLKAYKRLYGV